MNIYEIRRKNMQRLAEQMGGSKAMQKKFGKSKGKISHVIDMEGFRRIGDKLAAQVEQSFGKPTGWLDREHPDDDAILIPLISWNNIEEWFQNKDKLIAANTLIPAPPATSRNGYALRIDNDTMEAPNGITFPANSIVIVDPVCEIRNGSFVILGLNKGRTILFRQMNIRKGVRYYAKPLNLRYPIKEVTVPFVFYGVIRQMILVLA